MKLCIDLFCGLGGWAQGFIAEGYEVIGFDIEHHDYGTGVYPGQLVLQDVTTLCGSQFKDATVIVASPVVKSKEDYTRSRWQFDASPFWRSSGDRFLSPEEMYDIPSETLRAAWHKWNELHVYDYEQHVKIAEALERRGLLPATFMLLDPRSHSETVWDDVVRMRTLNTDAAKGRIEGHICPLQIDVCERLIRRYSNEGDVVLDPFAGLFTVPYVAVGMNRKGWGIELNSQYFHDGVHYLEAAELKVSSPTLFDVVA